MHMSDIITEFDQRIGWLYDSHNVIGEPFTLSGGAQFALFSVTGETVESGVISCIFHSIEPGSRSFETIFRSPEDIVLMGGGDYKQGLTAFIKDSIDFHRRANGKKR